MQRFFLSALLTLAATQAQDKPALIATGVRSNGWFQFSITQSGGARLELERSSDLKGWSSTAVLHGPEFPQVPVLDFVHAEASAQALFYRVKAFALTFEDDWRNQVFRSDDAFLSDPGGSPRPETRWIKFAIPTNQSRVYYQNSFKYPFHYDFATKRLTNFNGMSHEEFDAVSLRTNGQRVVLGTVLIPPDPAINQAGVQFVGQDAYSREQIATWLDLVRTTILPLDELKIVYMPSYEQAGVAEANREFFAARGYEVASIELWDSGQNAYSTGWGIGKLVWVPASELAAAYADGRLKPTDILLTDAIPAEIPYVAGIISLSASTPNSHVALLARSYGVPFVYLANEEQRRNATNWIGKEVVLSAYTSFGAVDVRLLDVSGADAALREEMVQSRQPIAIQIRPKEKRGAYMTAVDTLEPADIRFFGGKAANFGFLRRQVPTNSPPAYAISFDLWDEFMEQTMASGATLREEIASRLAKYSYPPDVGALAADLQAIRDMIEKKTAFTTQQQEAIAQTLLGAFTPKKKIRFRSSTNVEDSEEFVGAGLYDSYSGCLDDDLDADQSGPSACDPDEVNERGVFRAIRKVYASFYNQNAVLERLRHGVKEAEAGMAVLVHYSNPDEEEMANGVATLTFERGASSSSYIGQMVTQKGAVSVTNPDGSAQPEVVSVSKSFETPYFTLRQGSTLVPLGGQVLGWTGEYATFAKLFEAVAEGFESYYPLKTNYTLDFEYKKILPGQFLVKQVRELPRANQEGATYLLNSPSEWCVFQGEYGSVFANHRLKARLSLTTKSLKVSTNSLAETILGNVAIEYAGTNGVEHLSGNPTSFPEASHNVGEPDASGYRLRDSWRMGDRLVSLTTRLKTVVAENESPIQSLDGMEIEWSASYPVELPEIQFGAQVSSNKNEAVRLKRYDGTNTASILVERTVSAENVRAHVSFFWPPSPGGFGGGYTAPLAAWKETRITGLTSEPLLLHGYYSQSYRPEHHNFSENFLFEPALESGLAPALLAELENQNIRYIYVYWAGNDQAGSFWVGDKNWNFRELKAVPPPSDKP